MHEGDHGIIDDTHDEFEQKFSKSKHKAASHGSDHSHDHTNKKNTSDQMVKIFAGIVVIALIGAVFYFKFL
jgi:hypothetical protein